MVEKNPSFSRGFFRRTLASWEAHLVSIEPADFLENDCCGISSTNLVINRFYHHGFDLNLP